MENELLSQLNEEQRAAAACTEGPVMIIAGAGSGKTRTLTYRIAHLVEQGVDSFNILALTFTNKAAGEMKDRIIKLVGREARNLWMGTFHSVFARILRSEAGKLGYIRTFTIYDNDDSKGAIKQIIKQLRLDPKTYSPNYVLSRISMAKSNLIDPETYKRDPEIRQIDDSSRKPLIGEIYALYNARLRNAMAMDFDDLLYNTNVLLRDFPDYYQIFAKKTFTYNKITQPNHNLLLFRNDDVDGLKAGYSDIAGYHLITGSHRNGRRIFSIVIGASSNEARAIESRKLLNYALEAFDTQKIYAANAKITDLPVLDGSHTRIEAGTAQDVYLTFPRHSPQPPEIKISVPNVAHAPVKKGQTLGMLQVYAGGKLLTEQPLIALDDMPYAGFFGRLWSYVWYWWKS